MTSKEIRQQFLDFFASKGHKIVPSAPMVNKNDPTLMFTNAGMNQFKDYFLGNQTPDIPRIADTQKCLRVSGKHNDLEEVGRDSYHQTMFEMLGNWSFGDYFKKEAIAWAWELLTEVYGLPKDRLYVTVFEGDQKDNLEADEEAVDFWAKYIDKDRILYFDRKDNFWEMGDTGPCGPCSEIHIDIRPDADRQKEDGKKLVNMDHPLVIEIWNLVFIQFNRKANGQLEELPAKHIDTGMGFERLTMAMQGKQSNYDTDIFSPYIEFIEKTSGKKYTGKYEESAKVDIAMRVVADHVRAVAFAIADGQLPSNTGAGYVIRRILRRAVRYYYTYLDIKSAFLHQLVPLMSDQFSVIFPELTAQKDQIAKVIEGEENAFLNTLENGLKRFDNLDTKDNLISGKDAFELYDTYGFPIDLTRLIAEEQGLKIDEKGFEKALAEQKSRSRKDAEKSVGDWTDVKGDAEVTFVGYDHLEVEEAEVLKYRTVTVKKKDQYQIVLTKTPFYAESGGQRGDRGHLLFGEEKIHVLDTQKENDLIIHLVNALPKSFDGPVKAVVNRHRRNATANNHTAVHLMHAALHKVLGEHALQKGQDVDDARLRFDFSHFQKVTNEELAQIEAIVNQKVRENIPLVEVREMPIDEAKSLGATMLFGEKYGDHVRVITFDENYSQELCGGTHVQATGQIGSFKIVGESAVAAGIRRIEAVTAEKAEQYFNSEIQELNTIRGLFKNPKNAAKQVESLLDEHKKLKKEIEQMVAKQAAGLKTDLLQKVAPVGDLNVLAAQVALNDANAIKTLAYAIEKEVDNAVILFGAEIKGKPQVLVLIDKKLLAGNANLHAGQIIKQMAAEIKGGGGGQPFFATAGGSDVSGLERALAKGKELVKTAVDA